MLSCSTVVQSVYNSRIRRVWQKHNRQADEDYSSERLLARRARHIPSNHLPERTRLCTGHCHTHAENRPKLSTTKQSCSLLPFLSLFSAQRVPPIDACGEDTGSSTRSPRLTGIVLLARDCGRDTPISQRPRCSENHRRLRQRVLLDGQRRIVRLFLCL